MKYSERIEYLISCFNNSHEELLFRIKHRDNWLKANLIFQVTILALSYGVEIGGVKGTNVSPDILLLAIPGAFIFMTLYSLEDRLISLICNYLVNISKKEQELSEDELIVHNFDSSLQAQDYVKKFLPIRTAGNTISFCLIPSILFYHRFSTPPPAPCKLNLMSVIQTILLIAIIILIFSASKARKSGN